MSCSISTTALCEESSTSTSRRTVQRSTSTISGRGSTTSAARYAAGLVCWSAATDEHCELTTVPRGFIKYTACTLFMRRRKSNTGLAISHRAGDTLDGSGNPCRLCCGGTKARLPNHRPASKLAQFLADKVAAVRADTKDAALPTFTQHRGTQLHSFSEVSADDVRRVLLRSPAKTCAFDPLPTSVLLEVVDVLLPIMFVMCSISLR